VLRLRDIMTTDVTVLRPETPIRDAMTILASGHISGAPVVSGRRVVGVVSATDLLLFAAELPGLPTDQPQALQEDAELPDEIEGNDPAGAFFHEMWNDAGSGMNERIRNIDGSEWNALGEHVVEEAMNQVLCFLAADTPVEFAAHYMREHTIHRVLVMEQDRLLGIVTTSDIAAAVADHKLTTRTYVFE
jgi:CBS domain-containing protein